LFVLSFPSPSLSGSPLRLRPPFSAGSFTSRKNRTRSCEWEHPPPPLLLFFRGARSVIACCLSLSRFVCVPEQRPCILGMYHHPQPNCNALFKHPWVRAAKQCCLLPLPPARSSNSAPHETALRCRGSDKHVKNVMQLCG
jgi:hypothetical protein